MVRELRWIGGLILVGATSALAQETTSADRIKAAAEEFDAGRRAYNARDYEAAATHFENADRDAPAPEALRNAIRAHGDAKHLARAATLAAAALTRYPTDKPTTKFARQVLQASEKQLQKVSVTCEPACTLLIDGKLAPLPEAKVLLVYIDPGSHRLSAGWSDDRHRDEQIEAQAGKESAVAFEAPPKVAPAASASESASAPPPPPPPPPRGGLPRPVLYAVGGATVVLGGVTLWSALDMRADPGRDKVRRDCAGRDESCATYQDALSKQRRTNVLLAVTAGAAVATGVVAWLTDWSSAPAESTSGQVRPSFGVGQRGWLVGAEGQF